MIIGGQRGQALRPALLWANTAPSAVRFSPDLGTTAWQGQKQGNKTTKMGDPMEKKLFQSWANKKQWILMFGKDK